jgi:hypothetical protein
MIVCRSFFGALSRFLLYLFGYGLRFAPPATKKDVASIGARIAAVYSNIGKMSTNLVILKGSKHNNIKNQFICDIRVKISVISV